MKKYSLLAFALLSSLLFSSCEKDITVDLPAADPTLIVLAQIEPDSLCYVSLSKNQDYFNSTVTSSLLDFISQNAISGAKVILTDGIETDTLKELTNPQEYIIRNFSFFNYVSTKIKGKFDHSYSLSVIHPNYELTANTRIPAPSKLDSIWWEPKPNPTQKPINDSLVRLMYRYTDPITPGNCVRAMSKRNSEFFWSSDNRSIYEDGLINGNSVVFPLRRGKEWRRFGFEKNMKQEEVGFFRRGDTISVKWSSIDRPTYDFWRTCEAADGGSGNPFRTPVYLQSNLKAVRGKVNGVFCGYGTTVYSIIVPNL